MHAHSSLVFMGRFFLEEATSSSFGDKTVSLFNSLNQFESLYIRYKWLGGHSARRPCGDRGNWD